MQLCGLGDTYLQVMHPVLTFLEPFRAILQSWLLPVCQSPKGPMTVTVKNSEPTSLRGDVMIL